MRYEWDYVVHREDPHEELSTAVVAGVFILALDSQTGAKMGVRLFKLG
jgi:hypothetical protein